MRSIRQQRRLGGRARAGAKRGRRRMGRKLSHRRSRTEPSHPQPQAAVLSEQRSDGYSVGYEAGRRAGESSYGTYFHGTSIIIPSYNQADYLKLCIDSIIQHTHLPYEIIVVDNASTDHTADYLHSMAGRIRYRIMEENRGFAGAVNAGLMMAKGMKLLLLNNDTLVTENWLSNLLACLESDPRIGLVGPVTNFISGEQRVDVPYTDVKDMPTFAAVNNISDPARWQRVDRLTGFCLLMRRELWERTGYFDEGYKIGNFEDDDYNVRVRLQGYSLVIARDVFIHHFGSVSMKALGEQRFHEVNDRNEHYYMEKWANPGELIHEVRELRAQRMADGQVDYPVPLASSEAAFQPQYVAIRSVTGHVYWVEDGHRRPVEGSMSLPAAELPLVDVRRWPLGEAIGAQVVEQHWNDQHHSDRGRLVACEGALYWLEPGIRRRIHTALAASLWGLHSKQPQTIGAEELNKRVEGLPIIAPVRIAQRL